MDFITFASMYNLYAKFKQNANEDPGSLLFEEWEAALSSSDGDLALLSACDAFYNPTEEDIDALHPGGNGGSNTEEDYLTFL